MKKQFNKSEIFKAAWSLVKTAGKTISEALKAAWAKAKAPVVSGYAKVAEVLSSTEGATLVSLIADKNNVISMRYKAKKELVALLVAEIEVQGEFEMPSMYKQGMVMSYNYSKFDIAKFVLSSNQVSI